MSPHEFGSVVSCVCTLRGCTSKVGNLRRPTSLPPFFQLDSIPHLLSSLPSHLISSELQFKSIQGTPFSSEENGFLSNRGALDCLGFTKSLAMTVLSEIGDKTFFAAAILAMRHPRKIVLAGCLSALIVMTILSATLGWAAPNLISRKWAHHVTTVLFFGFGFWTLWEGIKGDGDAEELKEVEEKLNADFKTDKRGAKSKDDDDLKKQQRSFLLQLFSPIFLKAFSITFFGEWGDKSQIATIAMASDEDPFGVVLGGILGQALCTTAAVIGGKSLASQISEKMVALSSGVLFLVFGLMSLLADP
ncbi:hypothetical protein LUZ63_001168 [Rhynchospora breviuscula]|uniref:GDT1 family protein n=1 Tax=Rhynchospora breviuscula TaxID=2022672 RepID=A0A9Q0CXP5_9POAL|nr:hypothetical protein LUZ63_001168 [Rhynchospora breviuscula]